MRKSLFIATAVLAITVSVWAKAKPKNDYIDRFTTTAIREKTLYNIPACISMAQGILESSWGEGKFSPYNNHFGIKCHSSWYGPSFSMLDDDYDAEGKLTPSCFRAYENAEESWRDHSEFLQQTRYQALFNYGVDYRAWAVGLQTAGYATDPQYANKLIGIIERYELYKLDGLEAAIPVPVVPELEAAEAAPVPVPAVRSVKITMPEDGETMPVITPNAGKRASEITEEEHTAPKAEQLPSDYLRGQGRKLMHSLEGFFQNLKKADVPKLKKNATDSENLDEITPKNQENRQKVGTTLNKGMIISEKIVAMK